MFNELSHIENVKTHKLFIWVLLAQLILTLGIGFITDTLLLGLVAGLIILSLPLYFSFTRPNLTLSKHIVAIAVLLMASLHIQQTMGMTEMHFQIFVLLAFLTFFRDWKVIITGTLVVVVHHLAGYFSQNMGGNIFVFPQLSPHS